MATALRDLEGTTSDDQASSPKVIHWGDVLSARLLELTGGASSAAAHALVDAVLALLGGASRPTSLVKRRAAVGALLADLMRLADKGLCGSHAMSNRHFTDLPFGFNIFGPLVVQMEAAGLLETRKTKSHKVEWPGQKPYWTGHVTRFRMTQRMVEMAEEAGAGVTSWKTHWRDGVARVVKPRPDAPRLVLRGRRGKVAGVKDTPPVLAFDDSEVAPAAILADLEAHNAFLAAQTIEGISFHGLRRIFNDGDQPGFAWRSGGRFYSLPAGRPYESMPAEERRTTLKINGEAVGEVDLTAPHLTILHALLGAPFDATDDPYAVAAFPREMVKLWLTHAFGCGSTTAKQWSKAAKERFAELEPGRELKLAYPIVAVRTAVLRRHPVLTQLSDCGVSALDLQFHEAEILSLAMKWLRERHETPALPIHDALIVGVSRLGVAREVLVEAFGSYLGGELGWSPPVVPSVKLKGL